MWQAGRLPPVYCMVRLGRFKMSGLPQPTLYFIMLCYTKRGLRGLWLRPAARTRPSMEQPAAARAVGRDESGEAGVAPAAPAGLLGGRGRALLLVLLAVAALLSIAVYATSGEGPGGVTDTLDVAVLPSEGATSDTGTASAQEPERSVVFEDVTRVPANTLSFAQIGDWGAEGANGKLGNGGVRASVPRQGLSLYMHRCP